MCVARGESVDSGLVQMDLVELVHDVCIVQRLIVVKTLEATMILYLGTP